MHFALTQRGRSLNAIQMSPLRRFFGTHLNSRVGKVMSTEIKSSVTLSHVFLSPLDVSFEVWFGIVWRFYAFSSLSKRQKLERRPNVSAPPLFWPTSQFSGWKSQSYFTLWERTEVIRSAAAVLPVRPNAPIFVRIFFYCKDLIFVFLLSCRFSNTSCYLRNTAIRWLLCLSKGLS